MAVVPTITFGGTNINTFGAWLQADVEGWLDAPEVKVDVAEHVGGIGGVVAETDAVAPRKLVLPVAITATSIATLDGYLDTLKAYLRTDVVLRFADGSTTREITGRLTGVRLRPHKVPLSQRVDGSLVFLCGDPLWRDTSDTTETINGTPNACALGTGPVSDWVLTITATTNSITDITITLGPHTLTYTGTIAAGQELVIDAEDFVVENNGVDDLANYVGGFPAVDPRDTPSVSAVKASGSGTLGGSLVYRKRYY